MTRALVLLALALVAFAAAGALGAQRHGKRLTPKDDEAVERASGRLDPSGSDDLYPAQDEGDVNRAWRGDAHVSPSGARRYIVRFKADGVSSAEQQGVIDFISSKVCGGRVVYNWELFSHMVAVDMSPECEGDLVGHGSRFADTVESVEEDRRVMAYAVNDAARANREAARQRSFTSSLLRKKTSSDDAESDSNDDEPRFREQLRSSGAPSRTLDRLDQRENEPDGVFKASSNGKDQVIYVLDSGVRADDGEIVGRVRSDGTWEKWWNDVHGGEAGSSGGCADHGTAVAVAAAGRTLGVANEAQLVDVRVLGCGGDGWLAHVITAVEWVIRDHREQARGHGAAVLTLAFGARGASAALDDALKTAADNHLVAVAAVGNDNSDGAEYTPAASPSVITVGATGSADKKSYFSNFGTTVDLFAPGEKVDVDSSGSGRQYTGTSMSAARVAGAVAAMLAEDGVDADKAGPSEVAKELQFRATCGLGIDYEGNVPRSIDLLLYVREDHSNCTGESAACDVAENKPAGCQCQDGDTCGSGSCGDDGKCE